MSQPATITLTGAGTSATPIALSPLLPGRAYGLSVVSTGGTAIVQTTVDDPTYTSTQIYGTRDVPASLQAVTNGTGDYGILTGAYAAVRLVQVGAGTNTLRVYQDGIVTS